MQNVTNTILFGKYQILSLLGSGSFGSVYLSKHTTLECYRAIKYIPRFHSGADTLLSEAKLLKSLQHPGIPTIYDIEQDDDFIYLIEEYMQGLSLEEFLLQQSTISQTVLLEFALQLCDIFKYLHESQPSPVLYLDLKPEHIIVCGMQLKLIDFNVSNYISNLGNICFSFGNTDFSAPELFTGTKPNLQSDIYSIGKIMLYLSNYLDCPFSPKFQQILNKAASADPACRFETVDQLISALQNQKKLLHQPQSRKKIAIVGSHPGCGTTHISIALVSTLNYLGIGTTYYEKRDGNSLQQLQTFLPFMSEHRGLLCYKFFKGYPNYGPGIVLPDDQSEFQIYNFGDKISPELMDADQILFICNGTRWHWQNAVTIGESLFNYTNNLTIICNMGSKNAMYFFAKQFSKSVYYYPFDPIPFRVNKSKLHFTSQLFPYKRRNVLFFRLKNMFIQKK